MQRSFEVIQGHIYIIFQVPRDPHVKEGTIKLHVGGINMNGNAEEFGDLFREHTTVHQHHLMPNKEIWKMLPKNVIFNYKGVKKII